MVIIVIAAIAAIALVTLATILLADFARASRNDALFHPADSSGIRRARRVTGMYTRGSDEHTRSGDEHDQLVGR
ncbi:hypothetical protein [Actinomadura macrotermitis]|uniref:Uncharacterized protein n=1 Tax=Actinomadura macrotermitis TaxID=2585200 RepID=A0A7K0C454_9ACTN|nr:hypothetical protein [Actinomadura macrotermitis]MQY08208.1 hypothetical protein [Actinomadura macrotermitis]